MFASAATLSATSAGTAADRQNGCAKISAHVARRVGSLRRSAKTRSSNASLSGASFPPSRSIGGGSSVRIISMSSASEADTNGGFPAASSYSTHPNAYRSDANECDPPSSKSSGAM